MMRESPQEEEKEKEKRELSKNTIEEEGEDKEESFYVLLELPQYDNSDLLGSIKEYLIRDLESTTPILQLDDRIFQGTVEDTVGSHLLFEQKLGDYESDEEGEEEDRREDGNPKRQRVVGIAESPIICTKKIRFRRAMLDPKQQQQQQQQQPESSTNHHLGSVMQSQTLIRLLNRTGSTPGSSISKKQDKEEEEEEEEEG